MSTTASIVQAFLKALGSNDFAGARQLLADDFHFVGPFDTFDTPEPYVAALRKLYPIVKGITVQHLFVDGEDACLLYEMETSTAAGTAFICEWFRVRGGAISSMRAVFDARPFAPLFSK